MAMLSRKKIISRSQSDLDFPSMEEMEDEIWFSKDKLYQDHISEILKKWDQIDDEIWSKVICMERNRRIAKAYTRVPVLTITGSKDGFDGYQIGLNGFQNPMRDFETKSLKSHIGKGVRLRMDQSGNIIVKRLSNCDVFIRGWEKDNNSLSDEITELNGELELEKSVSLFDMKKFQASVNRELKSAYPNRRKLENQCMCAIVFVKDSTSLLDVPTWVLLINIVALDLLKSRLPAVTYSRHFDSPVKPLPRFNSGYNSRSASDEDPYSILLPSTNSSSGSSQDNTKDKKGGRIASNSSSNSSSESVSDHKPPELPPRDFTKAKKGKSRNLPFGIRSLVKSGSNGKLNQVPLNGQIDNCKNQPYENPYYCGMQARVPNFGVKEKLSSKKTASDLIARKVAAAAYSQHQQQQQQQQQQQSQKSSSLESPIEIKKSQSNGYLNTLFSQSSNLFGGKKSRERSKKADQVTANGFFYHTSLDSSGFFGSNDSDIYQYSGPSAFYGRTFGAEQQTANGNSSNFRKRHGNSSLPLYEFSTYRYPSDWD